MYRKAMTSALIALGLLIALSGAGGASAETALAGNAALQRPEYVPGEVLVKLNSGIAADRIDDVARGLKARVLRRFAFIGVHHLQLPSGTSVPEAIDALQRSPLVAYAAPNGLHYLDATTPDDPSLDQMWALQNTGQGGGVPDADIDAPEAWDLGTGSHDVVIAVIDSGIDLDHEDLAANIWTNPGEIPGNGIDDDGNGYVDDVHGWDFAANDSDPSPAGGGCVGHGTHTAGTIGAVGDNGTGVVGVNWNVTLMPLKAFRPFLRILCAASDADLIAAIEYYTTMGVRVSNNSWGGVGANPAMIDAIRASNSLFVTAAGNDGGDSDAVAHYPSNYDLDNIVSVAATDRSDSLAGFSNYGLVSVDLGAPGTGILSTLPGDRYGSLSGTSMAAPHVAGVAGLLLEQDVDLTVNELKWRLLNGTDETGLPVATGGRLNAYGALQFGLSAPDVTVILTPLMGTDVSPDSLFLLRISITNHTAGAIEAPGRLYLLDDEGREVLNRALSFWLQTGQTLYRRLWVYLPDSVSPGTTVRAFAQVETPASFDEDWVAYTVVP